MNSNSDAGEKFQQLVDLMARLRAPGGCPWDREQTFDTIKPYLLEETYEVMDAIDARDWRELAGELGDLLLQAVFFSQMAAEEKLFRIEDALDAINAKAGPAPSARLRGPDRADAGDVRKHLERGQGRGEEAEGRGRQTTLLGSVPRALPALVEAQQITSRAAHVGFDWENAGPGAGEVARGVGASSKRRGATRPRRSWKTNWATCCSCW